MEQSYTYYIESKQNRLAKGILFLVSPFLSLLYSLKSLNNPSSYAVLFGFCVCFGMAFSVPLDRDEYKGDGVVYRVLFEDYVDVDSYEYFEDLADYLTFDAGAQDFYCETVAYIVSRFTSNYHVFFMVLAIVFAIFQLKCLRFFTSHPNYKASIFPLLLLVLFSWNSIYNINGCRFWTAAWVGVYVMLQVVLNHNYKYLLLAFLTPFIHGGFFVFLLLLTIGLVSKRFENVWMGLFFLSFLFSSVAVDLVQQNSSLLPEFLARKADIYASDEHIKEVGTAHGTGYYMVGYTFRYISRIYVNILVLVLLWKRKVLLASHYGALYQFTIAWVAMCNFLMAIPSVGNRFFVLGYSFIALLLLEIYKLDKKIQYVILCFPLAFFMNIFYLLKDYWAVTNTFFWISSPFVMVFKYLLA